jgi:hypothetical protein
MWDLWWIKWYGVGFLRVLTFPLPILIPPNAPYSSIIWGWHNRPTYLVDSVSPHSTKKKTDYKSSTGGVSHHLPGHTTYNQSYILHSAEHSIATYSVVTYQTTNVGEYSDHSGFKHLPETAIVRFSFFFSVPPSKCWERTLKKATAPIWQLHSRLWFKIFIPLVVTHASPVHSKKRYLRTTEHPSMRELNYQ